MTTEEIHHIALDLADRAFYHQSRGEVEQAFIFFDQALVKEKEAAVLAKKENIGEPTVSILFRSAAALAGLANKFLESQHLALEGLAGTPPPEIEAELIEIRDEAVMQIQLRENIDQALLTTTTEKPKAPTRISQAIYLKEIPENMLTVITNCTAGLAGVGLIGGTLAPGADLVVIAPVWVGMTLKLAELAGDKMTEQNAKKIAMAVMTGTGTFLAGAKLSSTVFGWLTAPFTFGVSLAIGAASNASFNALFTRAYGRAVARFFLADMDFIKEDVVVKTLIALVGSEMGFKTPYDEHIGGFNK